MVESGSHTEAAPYAAIMRASKLLIAVILILVTLVSALALDINAPESVSEGENVQVSVEGAGLLMISIDGTHVATGMNALSHTMHTNSSSAGLYTFDFTSNDPSEQNVSLVVEVENVPLEMTLRSPTASETALSTVYFAVTTDQEPELCYVTIDGTSHSLARESATEYGKNVPITDGVHTITYKCKLGEDLVQQTRSLLVDTAAPTITSTAPSGDVTGPHVTLRVDTDEIARCRYDMSDGPYASLQSSMGSTYALKNAITLTLSSYGPVTYFVRCEDVHANVMEQSRPISFLAQLGPTGKISLIDADEPLTDGTYEVVLETDMPLASAPKLSYQLDGSSGTVPLNGDDQKWKGFVKIPEDSPGTVLSFTYEGVNQQGVVGSVLDGTRIFEVDAVEPNKIFNLEITNTTGGIRLEWPDDETQELVYNVYRSDEEGVIESDYIAQVTRPWYIDTSSSAEYYYYRVAAVDEAGNVGPLSNEVWASAIQHDATDPVMRKSVTQEIIELQVTLLDINASLTFLEEEPNPTKSKIIQKMDLVDRTLEMKIELENHLNILQRKKNDPNAQQAIVESQKARQKAQTVLIDRIEPDAESVYNEPTDPDAIERNIAYSLAAGEKEAYIEAATLLQEQLTVNVEVMRFKLWNRAGQGIPYTYVEKKITLDEPINDVQLVEIIPKEVAQDVADIVFSKEPVVLEEDPVVAYSFPVLEQETYSYYVQGVPAFEDVKRSRALLYPRSLDRVQETVPLATGQAITLSSFASVDTFLIALAIVIVLSLVLYYFSLSDEPAPFKGLPVASTPRPSVKSADPAPVRIVRKVRTTPNEPFNPKRALSEAEEHIDGKAYESALDVYKRVLAHCEEDEGVMEHLTEQLERVYHKLMLHRELQQAKVSLSKRDAMAAQSSLSNAREHAENIGPEDTVLIQDATHAFQSFVRELNRVEIERMADF